MFLFSSIKPLVLLRNNYSRKQDPNFYFNVVNLELTYEPTQMTPYLFAGTTFYRTYL